MDGKLRIDVLLITYRRSTYLKEIIQKLASLDANIFVYSNGPSDEACKRDIMRCRAIIDEYVAAGVVFKTKYLTDNLPVQRSIPTSISWFFENVGSGIVLEDDCVPTGRWEEAFLTAARLVDNKSLVHVNMHNKINLSGNRETPVRSDKVKLVNVWGWASNSHTWSTINTFEDVSFRRLSASFKGAGIPLSSLVPYYVLYLLNRHNIIKTWDFIYTVKACCSGAAICQLSPSVITNTGMDEFSSNHNYTPALATKGGKLVLGFEYDKLLLNSLYRPMLLRFNTKRVINLFKRIASR